MENEVKKDMEPELTVQALISFLEYEEAYTKDKETANRIKTLLKLIEVWN